MAESPGETSRSAHLSMASSAIFIPASAAKSVEYQNAASSSYSLQEPSESQSGIFFASHASPLQRPRQIARSPKSRNSRARAKEAAQAESRSARNQTPYHPKLVENTLKLKLSVAPRPPPSDLATAVTLAHTSDPCPTVIFEQNYFRRTVQQSPPLSPSTPLRPPPYPPSGLLTDEHSSAQWPVDSATGSSSASMLNGVVTSPTSTNARLSVNDGDDSSTAEPASPRPLTTAKAWNKPRSWAALAAKGDSNAFTYRAPAPVPSSSVSSSSGSAPLADSMSSLPSQSPSQRAPSGTQAKAHQGLNGKANGHILAASKMSKMDTLMDDADKQFIAPLTYPRGMINKGNFCFANAILQVLVYCAPFYNLFQTVNENVPHDFNNSTPLMEAIIQFLKEFQRIPSAPRDEDLAAVSSYADLLRDVEALSEPFVPEFVYEAMRLNKRFDLMRRGHQEDAEEFLGFILDTLHEELMTALKKWQSRTSSASAGNGAMSLMAPMLLGEENDDAESDEREVRRPLSPSEEGWLEVGQKGKTSFTRTTSASESPITRIFGGKLRSVLKTPGVKDSVTLEPYQPLQLDIQPPNVTSIDEALENLCAPETIPGVFSPARNGLVDATKQVFIETLPPVLILHLKRFVYDEVGGVQKSSKEVSYGPTIDISDKVLSPTRRMEGVKKKYRLFGVVYHHGRFASGGHYTVDVLRQDQSEWLHIDDTFWTSIAAPSLKTSGDVTSKRHDGVAYLLFYAREDVAPAATMAAIATESRSSTPLPSAIAKKEKARQGEEGINKRGDTTHSRANSAAGASLTNTAAEKTRKVVPGSAAAVSKKTAAPAAAGH